MIDQRYVVTMADYNRWQNASVYTAASALGSEDRLLDRGAFFGSIEATLNHILWGDQIWLSRFTDSPAPAVSSIPESVRLLPDFETLCAEREAFDQHIIDWANSLDPAWLETDHTWYSGAMGREVTKPAALLVVHLFNHQTHHRGQVNAMLTACGATLDDTDLPFAPH